MFLQGEASDNTTNLHQDFLFLQSTRIAQVVQLFWFGIKHLFPSMKCKSSYDFCDMFFFQNFWLIFHLHENETAIKIEIADLQIFEQSHKFTKELNNYIPLYARSSPKKGAIFLEVGFQYEQHCWALNLNLCFFFLLFLNTNLNMKWFRKSNNTEKNNTSTANYIKISCVCNNKKKKKYLNPDLRISSLQWGFSSPAEKSFTPESSRSLLLRSSSVRVEHWKLSSEDRALQLLFERLQPSSLKDNIFNQSKLL